MGIRVWFPTGSRNRDRIGRFLKPEKTHLRSVRPHPGVLRAALLLELFRRPISKSRMQSPPIVVAVQKLLDMRPRILQIAIFPAINLLGFERLQEALGGGVVVKDEPTGSCVVSFWCLRRGLAYSSDAHCRRGRNDASGLGRRAATPFSCAAIANRDGQHAAQLPARHQLSRITAVGYPIDGWPPSPLSLINESKIHFRIMLGIGGEEKAPLTERRWIALAY